VAKSASAALIDKITQLQLYRDYERAFSDATHLPLNLRPVDDWNLSQRGNKNENPFCALIAKHNPSCAKCLQQQQRLSDTSGETTKTSICFAGLCESAVPVHLGGEIIGFLRTGQIALQKPSKSQFSRLTRMLLDWGVKTDLKNVADAYFHSRVIAKAEYHGMLRLLDVFAKHLSMAAEQITIQQDHAEPPSIRRAKEFIQEHISVQLSLSDVSRKVNMSTFYFCKMFKKYTGITFTEYLSLVRISKAKNLLLNPNLRISEIAFEVGFQSLTHFNRVFLKIVGRSPTRYREQLRGNNGSIRRTRARVRAR
jgi:AraC-like DNA-binding protein